MSKQQELINRIRREEFGIDANLQGEAKTIFDNMVRKYRNLLSTVAEDLNSKESHFILELIQNADDNSYDPSVDPSLSFSLEDDRLIVKNNEIGFNEKNIRAICSAGESSKKSEKRQGYIGEKGIGFKSIFKVTDSPEIHSNGFHFHFDRSNPSDLLGYVVPHWREPDIQLDEQTTLVIPPKLGHQFSASTLADVSDSLLLFLQKLRKLDVKTPVGQYTYHRQDHDSFTTLVTTKLGEVPIRQNFLRKSFKVDMSGINETKREGIKETEIVLAFPIDGSGNAMPILGCATYAFLPIRDFGFNFYIQADFVLASSREAIHEELAWNIRLRDAISDAFIETVDEFKRRSGLAQTYLKYFPTKKEVYDPFFSVVVEQLNEKLKTVECVPVMGGSWKKPAEVLLASEKFRELFLTQDALWIFGADYLIDGFILPQSLKESLGFKVLMPTDVTSVFTNNLDWIRSKSSEWQSRFYAYLANSVDRKSYLTLLEKLPCIPLEDGTFVVPSESLVFFPLSAGEKYGFEHELLILKTELMNQVNNITRDVRSLFSELGVKIDNPYDLIHEYILKLHSDDKWTKSDNEALIGHVRYIKDKLAQYIETATANGQQESVAISALIDGLYIGTKNNKITDEQWYFDRISNLYLGTEFQPEFDLENLLQDKVSLGLFVAPEYINLLGSEAIKEVQVEEVAEWRNFFLKIGVNISPRVILESNGNIVCSKELNSLLNSDKPTIRRRTLELLDRNWNNYPKDRTYVFKSGRNWNRYHTGLVTTLKSVIAPTLKTVRVTLPATYMNNDETRTVLGDSVVFVDAELYNCDFLDVCGITYKLDSSACLKRLQQLKEENAQSFEQIYKIYSYLDLLWDIERVQIETAFNKERLIRIGKGKSLKWVLPEETCWNDTKNQFLDQLYPSLMRSFRDCHGFFVKKLKVPESLSIQNWVDALKNFDKVAEDKRSEFALSIYIQLNQEIIRHYKSSDQSFRPDWVDDLNTYSLLLNRRGELVSVSEHFYADDRPDISKLFEDEEGISFLNIPPNKIPSIKFLINELKIQQVSNVVEVQVSDDVKGTINNLLTAKLREMIIPIARIIYSQSPQAFDNGVKTGLFKMLSKSDILDVSSLALKVTLGDLCQETSGLSVSRENEILLVASTGSKHDYVAMEVEKILVKPGNGASAQISRVLMAASSEVANEYLDILKVTDIPDDEIKKLLSSISYGGESALKPNDEETEWIESTGDGDSGPWNDASTTKVSVELGGEFNTLRNDSGNTHRPNATPTTLDVTSQASTENLGSDSSARVQQPGLNSASGLQPANTVVGQNKPFNTAKLNKNIDSSRSKSKPSTKSGRLLSYAESKNPKEETEDNENQENSSLTEHKKSVERAAVQFFMETAVSHWRHVEEMPVNNPGFDFSAESLDGNKEFIEIKGQSGAWTEEGVALTPTELLTAAKYREHYWLCVVEFALDNERRRLWLVKDPFGKTNQFRFDRGWQDVSEKRAESQLRPEAGFFVTIPDLGKVLILEVLGKGLLLKLKVELEDKSTVTKVYSPAVMKLSEE